MKAPRSNGGPSDPDLAKRRRSPASLRWDLTDGNDHQLTSRFGFPPNTIRALPDDINSGSPREVGPLCESGTGHHRDVDHQQPEGLEAVGGRPGDSTGWVGSAVIVGGPPSGSTVHGHDRLPTSPVRSGASTPANTAEPGRRNGSRGHGPETGRDGSGGVPADDHASSLRAPRGSVHEFPLCWNWPRDGPPTGGLARELPQRKGWRGAPEVGRQHEREVKT